MNDDLVILRKSEVRNLIRDIFREELAFLKKDMQALNGQGCDELITSIKQIADLFHCSLPTAQKIKNQLPKDKYAQWGDTFAIPKSVLLQRNDLNKGNNQ